MLFVVMLFGVCVGDGDNLWVMFHFLMGLLVSAGVYAVVVISESCFR